MTATVSLRVGEWTPDRNPIGNGPNLIEAQDCYPVVDGYRGYPALVASLSSGSLNAACVGAAAGRRRGDGTAYTAAATATKLYVTNSGGVLTDRTGTWSLGGTSTASFVQYEDRLLVAAIEHIIQSHTLSGAGNFADVSADAPKARNLAVISKFVMAGNIVGQGANASAIGTARDGLQWSAFMNPASWPVVGTDAAKAVLSDYRVMPGFGGDVQGITGGRDYGIVIQERQVLRAEVTGGDTFFNFVPIDTINGCDIPQTVIQVGPLTFYHAQAGWMSCNGEAVSPIGHGKVDRFFADDIDTANTHLCSAAADPNEPLVLFAYPGAGHAAGACNRILAYNYALNRWSLIASESVERLVRTQQVGPNVDTPISSDIDGSPFDVDAVSFDGARPSMAAFAAPSHSLSAFNGATRAPRLVCGDFEASPGRRSFVRGVRPQHSVPGSAVLRVGARNAPAQTPTFTGWSAADSVSGMAGVRSAGRYHRVELYGLTDIGILSGFDADVETEGLR